MRTNHLAIRISTLLTFLLLLTVVVRSSNSNRNSSTAQVSPARTHLAVADPSGSVKISFEPTQLRLVSTTFSEVQDELQKTFLAVYNIPILAVRSRALKADPNDEGGQTIGYTGVSETIEMEFTRRLDGSPFRLAISEENPGSSGPSLQSSFWQAAVVAALHESDDLSGVRVTFSVPSDIDGPSVGGVTALSLLSAINQKELPDDFAFTGSILPDGTIGRIGGIVEKLRAAKEQGASRMLIPTGMRLAEDMTTGELIDLQVLATECNITLVPVRNLTAAYREIHRLPEDSQSSQRELEAKLPKALESLLLRECQTKLSEGDAIWEKIDEKKQGELLTSPIGQRILPARSWARQALHTGQFCYAFDSTVLYAEYLKAREGNLAFFKAFWEQDEGAELYPSVVKEIKRLMLDTPTPEDLLDKLGAELPPITSQLFFDIYDAHSWYQMIVQMDETLRSDVEQIQALQANQIPAGQTKEDLLSDTILLSQSVQLLLTQFIHQLSNGYHALGTRQGETLADMDVDRDRVQKVERFFYAAFRSIEKTFTTEVIESMAKKYDVPVDDVVAHVMEYDTIYDSALPVYRRIHQLHDSLEEEGDSKASLFKTTFNAHLCASSVAELSGIVVRWSQLVPFVDENNVLVYQETSMVSQLIREARRNSIEKMNQCYEKGIPCVSSIGMFEYAEAQRDNPSTDKVDVLLNYWQASLQAQALQMIFNAKKKPKAKSSRLLPTR